MILGSVHRIRIASVVSIATRSAVAPILDADRRVDWCAGFTPTRVLRSPIQDPDIGERRNASTKLYRRMK
jgi:hypothetical protein